MLSLRTLLGKDDKFYDLLEAGAEEAKASVDLFASYQQVIFWKRTDDLLSNPKADRLLTQAPINEFLLFGVGLETSIKALALALVARSKKVTIVQDACGYWSAGTADQASLRMVVSARR